MKKLLCILLLLALLPGCAQTPQADLAATTLPVWEFTRHLCEGTGLQVERLVTENVSCLHDYTLKVRQMQAISGADAVILSGMGLEDFLEDALSSAACVIDASQGIAPLEHHEEHHHEEHGHAHAHAQDPHIWLSPANAKVMAENICRGLCKLYPTHAETFRSNLPGLLSQLDALQAYGEAQLSGLSSRELITFHDGFSYFAESFDLHILRAIEEESGSEASAAQLIELINLVNAHQIKAIFTEINGADAAARILRAETQASIHTLDMAMAGDSYFVAMYRNIETIKEALK